MMDWTPPPPLACSLTPIHAPTPSLVSKVAPEKLSLGSPFSNGLLLPVGPTAAKSQFKADLYLLNASFLI